MQSTTGAALLDVHSVFVLCELRNYVKILFCHSLYVLLCSVCRDVIVTFRHHHALRFFRKPSHALLGIASRESEGQPIGWSSL